MSSYWRQLILVYGTIAALVALFHLPSLVRAYAQDGVVYAQYEDDYTPPPTRHERYHGYYQHWRQPIPARTPCCSATTYTIEGRQHISGDCEPTSAEIRRGRDGKPRWFAMLPEYARDKGLGIDGGDWIEIPDAKIINERNPTAADVTKDGEVLHEGAGEEAHLCWVHQGKGADQSEGVLCFVPPFGSM